MIRSVTILPGHDKNGRQENFDSIEMHTGEMYTIVGNTGSGKSRLIKDLEQLADSDSVTGRKILLDGRKIPIEDRNALSQRLIAHLEQNMRFVLDLTVREFILLHLECRNRDKGLLDQVISLANEITPEPISSDMNLNILSGGQGRSLMIADVAFVCDSPVVLIDEIENAGIDKTAALQVLVKQNKLVLMVTHDPHTALMADKRIVMENGSVKAIAVRTPQEKDIFDTLEKQYLFQREIQKSLRKGNSFHEENRFVLE